MFYQDHEPAHFHAEYQGEHAKFSFDGELLAGSLRSGTARRLIQEWAVLHRADLDTNWAKMKAGEQLERIAPLDQDLTMTLLPTVIRAEYRGGYRIRIAFQDGVEKTIDFREWLRGPVFEPLKDEAYFRRFFIEGGTVTWPNGADIAPETLHESRAVNEAA